MAVKPDDKGAARLARPGAAFKQYWVLFIGNITAAQPFEYSETASDVDMVLGAGSAEAGARAHEIPPATESNGYATAGVAYARRDGEPVPVRFRFPFVRDAEIAAWVEAAGRRSDHGRA